MVAEAANSTVRTADVLAVIPARYDSQRFPGKPLADLAGRPVIAWVVDAASRAYRVGRVLVATDHPDIAKAAVEAGAETCMTSSDHATGSDRIGEAIGNAPESVILNVQGDEPLVEPGSIDRLVDLLEADVEADVSTLCCPCVAEDASSPHVVKVVRDEMGAALYFSRAPIPGRHPANDAQSDEDEGRYSRHVGLYGFRRQALLAFLKHPRGRLERAEGLEQLRFLEMGGRIVVGEIPALSPGIDTREDLELCRRILASRPS